MDSELSDGEISELEDWDGWALPSTGEFITYPNENQIISFAGPCFEIFVELDWSFVIVRIQFSPRNRRSTRWTNASVSFLIYKMVR